MNQILGNSPKIDFSYQKKIVMKFKIIFWFFCFISIIFIILFLFSKYHSYKKEKLSKSLVKQFNISTLYNNSNFYESSKLNFFGSSNNSPFVIGIIKIDKIELTYPILSESTDELLKISPCRFYGPMPNEIGNLCIAGHNNANDKLFGKLDLLNLNDEIIIYDLNGNNISYYIFNKKEVSSNDTSCINQNSNGMRQISLITCNNLKGSRLLLQAKEGSF